MANSPARLKLALRALGRLLQAVVAVVLLAGLALAVFELTDPAPAPHSARTDTWQLHRQTTLPTEIRGLTIQYFDGEHLWANRYDEVWRSEGPDGDRWLPRGSLGAPDPSLASALRHAAVGSRVARLVGRPHGIEGLLVLPTGTLLAARNGMLHRSPDGGATWTEVLAVSTPAHPHGLFRNWGADEGGRVWAADGRTLLRSDDDGASFAEAWKLPAETPGRIRFLRVDPFRGRPWVGLGGAGVALQLGYVDAIGELHPVGGDDPWIEVSDLVFTGGEVYLVNALPRGPTGLWRYSRVHGTVERIGDLGGPVLDAALMRNETLVLATAAAGLGYADVQLWVREIDGGLRQVGQFPTFGRRSDGEWGTLLFPAGAPLPDLRFTAERVGNVRRSLVVGALR